MPSENKGRSTVTNQVENDYETYRQLLHLWQSENPIKTIKLQVLLAVNALLVAAVGLAGGFAHDLWYVYATGMVFDLIWTFSIGRTALFQDLWQARLRELQRRYPDDPRFSILDNDRLRAQSRWMLRIVGAVPSRWYLLLSPLAFAIIWFAILVATR